MSVRTNDPNQHLQAALSVLNSLVDNHFECSICLDTFIVPNVIPECLHRFCDACIKTCIHKCGAECPTCRARITSRRDLRKDKAFEDIMSNVLSAIKSLKCVNTLHIMTLKEEVIESGSVVGCGGIEKDVSHTKDPVKVNGSESYVDHGQARSAIKSVEMPVRLDVAVVVPEPGMRVKVRFDGNVWYHGTIKKACKKEPSKDNTGKRKGGESHHVINIIYDDGTKEEEIAFPDPDIMLVAPGSERIDGVKEDEEVIDSVLMGESAGIEMDASHTNDTTVKESDQSVQSSTQLTSTGRMKRKASIQNALPPKMQKKARIGNKNSNKKTSRQYYTFEERCEELLRFKEEFGHCNVPMTYPKNPSFGYWYGSIRTAYKKVQEGKKPDRNLSQDRIDRLNEIGFQFQAVSDVAFETHCRKLIAFKEEFGHCNVPYQYRKDPSLGRWASHMKDAYQKIKNGMKSEHDRLPKERIERLDKIGFEWLTVYEAVFEQRCRELIAFKEESGHCNVHMNYNAPLHRWCNRIRITFNKLQKGELLKGSSFLPQHRIDRLNEIGFHWKGIMYDRTFDDRCRELTAFKEEFGHCNVRTRNCKNRKLVAWCYHMRGAYNKIRKGEKPDHSLPKDRIDRLEAIGFEWSVPRI